MKNVAHVGQKKLDIYDLLKPANNHEVYLGLLGPFKTMIRGFWYLCFK